MRELPKFLYHGTTSRCLEGILENGLVLNRARILGIPIKPVLFFTSSVKKARFYAFLRRRMQGFPPEEFRQKPSLFKSKGEPIVLRVQTSNLNLDALRTDFRWKLLGELGQWRYYKDVPTDAIEIEESPASIITQVLVFWSQISLFVIGAISVILIGIGAV